MLVGDVLKPSEEDEEEEGEADDGESEDKTDKDDAEVKVPAMFEFEPVCRTVETVLSLRSQMPKVSKELYEVSGQARSLTPPFPNLPRFPEHSSRSPAPFVVAPHGKLRRAETALDVRRQVRVRFVVREGVRRRRGGHPRGGQHWRRAGRRAGLREARDEAASFHGGKSEFDF